MVSALPSRIMNYNVSAASPTDELLTLGQILSEVGDYASTVLDSEHLSLSRKCNTRLRKVIGELKARNSLFSVEGLYDICPNKSGLSDKSDFATMTVSELHSLYRRWPIHHREREAQGREHFTFYREGKIVNELLRRKAANKAEQLKIDYCVATYHNELDNMSFVFSRPVQIDGEKINPDSGRRYSSEELTALIRLYSDYRDIVERELLVEYVDYALDLLKRDIDTASTLRLLIEIAELGRRKTIRIPEWVNKKLEDAVTYCMSLKDSTSVNEESALAEAMLTLQLLNDDDSLIRKAKRIINRCHKSAFEERADLGVRIENLYTAVTCCDYVSRFNVRKAAALWDKLSDKVLSTRTELSLRHIFLMLEIAKECEDYAHISGESKNRLRQMFDEMANTGSIESKAYNMIVGLKF